MESGHGEMLVAPFRTQPPVATSGSDGRSGALDLRAVSQR